MGHNKKVAALVRQFDSGMGLSIQLGDVHFHVEKKEIPVLPSVKNRDAYAYKKRLDRLSLVSDVCYNHVLTLTREKINLILPDLEAKVLDLSRLRIKTDSVRLANRKIELNLEVNSWLKDFRDVAEDWNTCLFFYATVRSIEKTKLAMDVSLLKGLVNAYQAPKKKGHTDFTNMLKLNELKTVSLPLAKPFGRSYSLTGLDKPYVFRSTLIKKCQKDPLFNQLSQDKNFPGVNERLMTISGAVDQKFGSVLSALQSLTDNNYFDCELFKDLVFDDYFKEQSDRKGDYFFE